MHPSKADISSLKAFRKAVSGGMRVLLDMGVDRRKILRNASGFRSLVEGKKYSCMLARECP